MTLWDNLVVFGMMVGGLVLLMLLLPLMDWLMTLTGVTEEEKQSMADGMDEFLYGEVLDKRPTRSKEDDDELV